MTEPRRRFDIEPKTGIPTLQQWGAYKRQAALYAQALSREIQEQLPQPLPAGDYALRDVDFTMEWWRRFAGEPVLVNKLRGRANQTLFSLNDLIHPETLEAMRPQTPGCGCVR